MGTFLRFMLQLVLIVLVLAWLTDGALGTRFGTLQIRPFTNSADGSCGVALVYQPSLRALADEAATTETGSPERWQARPVKRRVPQPPVREAEPVELEPAEAVSAERWR